MKGAKFLGCKINLAKKVFRPRKETEFWVGKVCPALSKKKCRVLDIFAGTGCIGTSILKACPEAVRRVDFVDISKEAVEQIKINLKLNKIPKNRYRIFQSDLFKKLAPYRTKGSGSGYDFIFANPPYVALDRISEVQKEVLKKEPKAALFAGKDGLVLIEKFLKQVKNYLKPAGKLFLEFDPFQKGKIEKIAKEEGLEVVFKKDQFGKYRWLEACVKI